MQQISSNICTPGDLITTDASFMGYVDYKSAHHQFWNLVFTERGQKRPWNLHRRRKEKVRGRSRLRHKSQQSFSSAARQNAVFHLLALHSYSWLFYSPITKSYIGEIGHVVVGRITSVESNRWRVNVNSTLDAMLPLSSVNLPGGELVS